MTPLTIPPEQFAKLATRDDHWLSGMRRGVEREALRANPDGTLAVTPHPENLGPAVTHPAITTDYSESLLEFITPQCASAEEAVSYLEDLQRETLRHMGDEVLWPVSMPCVLPDVEEEIPLAYYGDSDIGRLKTIYREGLAWRYGRRMQCIAGVHYNWSLPEAAWQEITGIEDGQDARNRGYFLTLRGFRRHYWLLMWLFGASPAIDKSFFGEKAGATKLVSGATSLRMSDLGYTDSAQQSLGICFNALHSYADTLADAVVEPYAAYEKIGTEVDGHFRQLSTALLQIENEYYSPARPKQLQERGERPVKALRARGVDWLEVRCLDVDPYSPTGIRASTMRFLDCFLLSCALGKNPRITQDECDQLDENQAEVAYEGRTHGKQIWVDGSQVKLLDAAEGLIKTIRRVAEALDEHEGGSAYTSAVDEVAENLSMPKGLPSARMERKIDQKGFVEWARERAVKHKERLLDGKTSDERLASLAEMKSQALSDEAALPRSQGADFSAFVKSYVDQPTA